MFSLRNGEEDPAADPRYREEHERLRLSALFGVEICPGFALIGSRNKQYTIQDTHSREHNYRLDNPPLCMKNVSLSAGNTTLDIPGLYNGTYIDNG